MRWETATFAEIAEFAVWASRKAVRWRTRSPRRRRGRLERHVW
jgi:hypothetical protein